MRRIYEIYDKIMASYESVYRPMKHARLDTETKDFETMTRRYLDTIGAASHDAPMVFSNTPETRSVFAVVQCTLTPEIFHVVYGISSWVDLEIALKYPSETYRIVWRCLDANPVLFYNNMQEYYKRQTVINPSVTFRNGVIFMDNYDAMSLDLLKWTLRVNVFYQNLVNAKMVDDETTPYPPQDPLPSHDDCYPDFLESLSSLDQIIDLELVSDPVKIWHDIGDYE